MMTFKLENYISCLNAIVSNIILGPFSFSWFFVSESLQSDLLSQVGPGKWVLGMGTANHPWKFPEMLSPTLPLPWKSRGENNLYDVLITEGCFCA